MTSRLKDYLTDHTQWALIGNQDIDGEYPDTINLQYHVPQESNLGLLLFMLYTTPLVTSAGNTTSTTICLLMTPIYALPSSPQLWLLTNTIWIT